MSKAVLRSRYFFGLLGLLAFEIPSAQALGPTQGSILFRH